MKNKSFFEMLDHKKNNAIIMAAGLSSRFAPLSYEIPKALLEVRGEIMIERQIRQLIEAGIDDITIVVGYKKEFFEYLKDKFAVRIVDNPEYNRRNNNSTLYYVKDLLHNTYICSADNYFSYNIFEKDIIDYSYYSVVYDIGKTKEWCVTSDEDGLITNVKIGGENEWVMLGHAYFNAEFSKRFVEILDRIYNYPDTASLLWESIYIDNIEILPMYVRKYTKDVIFEFDTLDELREFDDTYYNNSGSEILSLICEKLSCNEDEIVNSKPLINENVIVGFEFNIGDKKYKYIYQTKELSREGDKK